MYILLAVCAFLFPVLYSVRFETADFMSSWPVYVLTVIRYLPLVCLSAAIVLLLYAVKTIKISRVDVFSAVNEENAYSVSPIDAEIRFTLLYTACTDAGKAEQNRKYAVADIALVFVIVSVFLFIAAVMQREYSEVSKGGEVNMSVSHLTAKAGGFQRSMVHGQMSELACYRFRIPLFTEACLLASIR